MAEVNDRSKQYDAGVILRYSGHLNRQGRGELPRVRMKHCWFTEKLNANARRFPRDSRYFAVVTMSL